MLQTVRDGKQAPPTCPKCNCRLNIFEFDHSTVVAHHFVDFESDKDSAGHKCSEIGAVWTISSKKVKHLLV